MAFFKQLQIDTLKPIGIILGINYMVVTFMVRNPVINWQFSVPKLINKSNIC